ESQVGQVRADRVQVSSGGNDVNIRRTQAGSGIYDPNFEIARGRRRVVVGEHERGNVGREVGRDHGGVPGEANRLGDQRVGRSHGLHHNLLRTGAYGLVSGAGSVGNTAGESGVVHQNFQVGHVGNCVHKAETGTASASAS